MKTSIVLKSAVLSLSLLASSVMAAVSQQEADQLGTTLTPTGAEKAGNADGSIPAWTGGLPDNAGSVDSKGFLADPFANEQPLFTITAANATQYQDKLSAGQLAMLKRYPDSYKIPVYPSHRSAAAPEAIYAAAKKSALNTNSIDGGNGLQNFSDSRYYAFPIPKSGVEVAWNHITRYRGGNVRRWITQAIRAKISPATVTGVSSVSRGGGPVRRRRRSPPSSCPRSPGRRWSCRASRWAPRR